jgi:hypothetical protein
MARRMVVVPEEFLKVFKQEPQIPVNLLRNDDLLADRLNKALQQKTRLTSERQTASTQTTGESHDHIVDKKPMEAPPLISQMGINETLATPTVSFAPRAPEQQSTPSEFHSVEAIAQSPQDRSLEQRQEQLKRTLLRVKAWDSRTREVDNWEGGRIKDSNIDTILSYAFDPEGGEPPLGYRQIARHLRIMNETGFPNKSFQRVVDQSSGHSPVSVRRRMPTPYVTQRGKGKCCKKIKSRKETKSMRWTAY